MSNQSENSDKRVELGQSCYVTRHKIFNPNPILYKHVDLFMTPVTRLKHVMSDHIQVTHLDPNIPLKERENNLII